MTGEAGVVSWGEARQRVNDERSRCRAVLLNHLMTPLRRRQRVSSAAMS